MWPQLLLAGLGGTVTGWTLWRALTAHRRRFALDRACRRLGLAAGQAAQQATVSTRENRYSHLPSLRKWIVRFSLTPLLLRFLEQAGAGMNVSACLLLHACCLMLGSLAAWLLHLPVAAALALTLGAGAAPWLVLANRRRKRLHQLSEQLIDAAHLIASAMRAGLSFEIGVGMVASEAAEPIRGEFRKLVNEWRLCADMDAAFRNLALRVPTPDFQLLVACARLHREVGGNFAPLLDQLGATIRERFQLWRELKTLTAEGRFSGSILGALPIVVGAGTFLLQPSYFRVLFTHPSGRNALWLAILLQASGLLLIRWMTTPRIR